MKRFLAITLTFAAILLPQTVWAAISFVGSAVNSSSPNTATSVNISGIGIAAGDLILVAGGVGDTTSNGLAAPTEGGYSRVPGVAATLYGNLTNDINLDLYYKIAAGNETAVSFGAVGGTNASNVAVVMVFRGVDGTTPFDTNANTVTGTGTSNANPPSHNWSGASGVWTVIAGATGHTGAGAATFTFPTGYTTNAAQRTHDDTIDALVGMGYKTSPADPEDPAAFTAASIGTATANSWAAVTMSLNPQVTVPPTVTTDDATSIGVGAATLNGTISATGGENATIRGFAFGTNSSLSGGDTATSSETGSFSSASWSLVGSGLSITTSGIPEITALSSSRIAYFDDTHNDLRTYDFDGSSWAQVGNSLHFGTGPGAIGLATLSSNNVAFLGSTQEILKIYTFDGTDWTQSDTGTTIAGVGSNGLTALSSTRVAMYDDLLESLRAYDSNGSTWSLVGSGLSIAGTQFPALAGLSSSRIAWIDATLDSLRAYDFNGSTWSLTGNAFSITGITDVEMTALSSKRIALYDGGLESLSVYDFDGTNWTSIVGTTISGGGSPSLTALTSTRVAFYDTTLESLRAYDLSAFTQRISALKSDKTYYFRAYATNPGGTGYGSIQSFTTTSDASATRRAKLFNSGKIRIYKGGKVRIYGN